VKKPTTYTADHPMLRSQSGDPARGEFKPWERKQAPKSRRRRKRQ
jgi:hypothetical protein